VYSVIGLVVDDGSTYAPAVVFHGDMTGRVAGPPLGGSVLHVVTGLHTPGDAIHRSLEWFERNASEKVWEQGDVYHL
jgi:hypothetical protein